MTVTRIGVMIGSPGDAQEERAAIRDMVLRWNAVYGRERKVMLEPVMWETHATPGLLDRPQGMINAELIPQSDCLVAVFHARAGSHTGVEVSGTIEEVREFLKTAKHVSIYFYSGPVLIGSIDSAQLGTLRTFQAEVRGKGLVGEYATVEQLKTTLLADLGVIVGRVSNHALPDKPTPPGPPKTKRKPSARTPKPTQAPAQKPTKRPPQAGFSGVIDTSEDWCLLDNRFLRCESVTRPDDRHFEVRITSDRAEVDAALEGLRPAGYSSGKPIAFAYANDAFVVQCSAISSTQTGKRLEWQVTLQKENVEYGGGLMETAYLGGGKTYSVDDLAELRARRILLGEPEAPKPVAGKVEDLLTANMLEVFIQGVNVPLRIKDSPIQTLAVSMASAEPSQFLRCARLAAMFHLKAGGVVERIERLALGPMKKESVHVRFSGLRRQRYSSAKPTRIEIEGECKLPPLPT